MMEPSAAVYRPFMLRIYDFFVLSITHTFIWRCATTSVLLPFFQRNLAKGAHLDVGVGTGYFTAASAPLLAKTKNVTFLDLNPNTLAMAEQRLRRAGYPGDIQTVQWNALRPVPDDLRGKFDSISCFNTLHCIPSVFPAKASGVFANLSAALTPDGVIYGSTVLGYSAGHTWLGSLLVWLYNRWGIFGNAKDSAENLERALKGQFEEVEMKVVGVVALFEARKPWPRLG